MGIKPKLFDRNITKKNKIKHVQVILDELSEMKDHLIKDNHVPDEIKRSFLIKYLSIWQEAQMLNYYIKHPSVCDILKDSFKRATSVFSK